MRPFSLAPLALLPVALFVTGCAMTPDAAVSTGVPSAAISGTTMGGQSPIVGATISIKAYGSNGYGSTATTLATTTTGNNGSFSFPAGAYTCPQADTPLYMTSTGGNPGGGVNNSSALGAALSNCTQAKTATVIINEVTTVALAYALSHFFTPSLGAGSDDSFGGPSLPYYSTTLYSRGLVQGNSYTASTMVNINNGVANETNGNTTVEASKIYTIANILAACVNSTGSTSSTETTTMCGKLFSYTAPPSGGTRPSDTLQAAVEMALYPYQNAAALYTLQSTNQTFSGGLGAAPLDLTIGISYTTNTLGLAVNDNSTVTIDIDQQGNIWFPSNKAGAVGIVQLNPENRGFFGPYNTTGMVHPQHVAIDNGVGTAGIAWIDDLAGPSVSGYNVINLGSGTSFSLPGTTSNALTIAYDNSVDVSTYTVGTGTPQVAKINKQHTSYTQIPNAAAPGSGYTITSLAGDPVGGAGIGATNGSAPVGYYVDVNGNLQSVLNTNTPAQVLFTGTNFVLLNPSPSGGTDQLCVYQAQTCYNFADTKPHYAVAGVVDGGAALWTADQADASVQQIPVSGSGYVTGSTVASFTYKHDRTHGNTITRPVAIAVDMSGNVWVANAGCVGTGCTPGAFVLSELVGAGAPTFTPTALGITQSSVQTGTLPNY